MYSFLYSRLWRMYSPWICTDQRAVRNITHTSTTSLQRRCSEALDGREGAYIINPVVASMMRSRVNFKDV